MVMKTAVANRIIFLSLFSINMSIKYTKKKGRLTNRKSGGTNKKNRVTKKKNRVTKKNKKRISRKKRGGNDREPDELHMPEDPTPDLEEHVPHSPEGPPPGLEEPQVPAPDFQAEEPEGPLPGQEEPQVPAPDLEQGAHEPSQPRQEPGEPNEKYLVQNIEDLVVGNDYQVVYLWQEYEDHRTYNYRDNDIARLTRREGDHLFFENIRPLDHFEDFYTWDNNQKLRIYEINNDYVLKGGKRKNKKHKKYM
jgi:hypothetical protein